jgi:signal transduction histidine kinase
MKLSFKFKIALLSFTVSGALLIGFGLLFFAFAFQTGLDRMDREIRTMADSSLHSARPPEHWKTFDRSIQFIYGESLTPHIALLVLEDPDHILFQSENAPSELASLPRPATQPRPIERQRPESGTPFILRLDRNNDGLVSLEEFDGPPGVFHRTDTDRDEQISSEESMALMGPPPESGAFDNRFSDTEAPPLQDTASSFQTLETANGRWRVGLFSEAELTVLIAIDMNTFYAGINRFRIAFFLAVPLGLVLLGFTGWFLAARAMRPVAIIADTAEGITAKGLDRRIPTVGNDIELERLVTVINAMLDRLEKSYHQAVRFSADAAHELQTPLTILQGELDNAIQSSENGSEEQQHYSDLLEELSNLKAVVQKLLLLAHADEGRLKVNRLPVDLSDLVRSSAEDLEIMAPGLRIEPRIPDKIHLSADAALLNQILRNMTSNAAKYSTPSGKVRLVLESDEKEIRFPLSNTAVPIPDADRPLLFDRFHRVDKARTSAGSGLGLSLAREIARAHGGDLVLNPYADGQVSFTLSLPVA